MGRFSELPYLGMKLSNSPKFQKLHIYSLSITEGRNWAYFPSLGSGFWDTGQVLKLSYLGMKLGYCPKCQKLHIYPLSTPRGSKLCLFFLYSQRFPRNRQVFKIVIFGHETWQVADVPEGARITSFYPQGGKIELIFPLWAAVSEIRAIAIFWHETWQVAKVPKVACIQPKLLPINEFHSFLIYDRSFSR